MGSRAESGAYQWRRMQERLANASKKLASVGNGLNVIEGNSLLWRTVVEASNLADAAANEIETRIERPKRAPPAKRR